MLKFLTKFQKRRLIDFYQIYPRDFFTGIPSFTGSNRRCLAFNHKLLNNQAKLDFDLMPIDCFFFFFLSRFPLEFKLSFFFCLVELQQNAYVLHGCSLPIGQNVHGITTGYAWSMGRDGLIAFLFLLFFFGNGSWILISGFLCISWTIKSRQLVLY